MLLKGKVYVKQVHEYPDPGKRKIREELGSAPGIEAAPSKSHSQISTAKQRRMVRQQAQPRRPWVGKGRSVLWGLASYGLPQILARSSRTDKRGRKGKPRGLTTRKSGLEDLRPESRDRAPLM